MQIDQRHSHSKGSCEGKVKHINKKSAERERKRHNVKLSSGKVLNVYQWDICRFWHVGGGFRKAQPYKRSRINWM